MGARARRRAFILGLVGTAATGPLLAGAIPMHAQTPNRVYRLGHLANSLGSETVTRDITLPELAKLGFIEGRNLVVDWRVGSSDVQPGLMRELLAAQPDAVIAIGPAGIVAARATRTVPIVTFGFDPIELGLAASYARPGGNVTGVVILVSELEAKRLQLLLEAVPGRRRVAALVSSAAPVSHEAALRKAVAGVGVELLVFTVAAPADYPAAFAAMLAAGAPVLVISATSEFYRDGEQLAALALEARLPTVCEWAEMAHTGCLLGYGPNRTALRLRIANQIAQIFRGAAPGEIAIERPTVFEFAINLKIAKALGVTVPATLLAQARELIE